MFRRINIWQKVILSSGVLLWFYQWIKAFTSYKCENLTSTSGSCFIDSLILMPIIIGFIVSIPAFILFFIFGLGNKSLNKKVTKSKKNYLIIGIIMIFIFILGFLIIRQSKKIKDLKTNKNTNITCSRTEPYPMQPEFQRAISLIIQRFNETDSMRNIGKLMSSIVNCVDIQYAQTAEEIGGAEGIFYLSPQKSKEKLLILVSPKYKSYDDLLTALLLSHELNHAVTYSYNSFSKEPDKVKQCYLDEASAYMTQFLFFFHAMNQQERQSLISRGLLDFSSPAADFFRQLEYSAIKDENKVVFDTVQYVYAQPYYQKQCEGK
jgi:hypothetical protein